MNKWQQIIHVLEQVQQQTHALLQAKKEVDNEMFLRLLRLYFILAPKEVHYLHEAQRFLLTQESQKTQFLYRAYQAAFVAIEAQSAFSPLQKYHKVNHALGVLEPLQQQKNLTKNEWIEVTFLLASIASHLPVVFDKNGLAIRLRHKLTEAFLADTADVPQDLTFFVLDFILGYSMPSSFGAAQIDALHAQRKSAALTLGLSY
jgi:hypothetical protein